MADIYPVILADGSGTPLWPTSRPQFPKQFIRFNALQNHSFLQAASSRLDISDGFKPLTVLCNNDHRFLVLEQLGEVGITPARVVLEPVARNSAPSIAVAALMLASIDRNAILAIMPSDHVIEDTQALVGTVRAAAQVARTGKLVMIGVEARTPQPREGHIRRGDLLAGPECLAYDVAEFRSEPNLNAIRASVTAGRAYWNTGILVCGAVALLTELERHEPELLNATGEALLRAEDDPEFLCLDHEAFARSPSISIDKAILETTRLASMIPYGGGWSDIEAWSALADLGESAPNGSYINGSSLYEAEPSPPIPSDDEPVAAAITPDPIAVEPPATITAPTDNGSTAVADTDGPMHEPELEERVTSARQHRPWGYLEPLNAGSGFEVQLLHLEPGAKLSLQMHHHRSEHWVVVSGTARVTRGRHKQLVGENESFSISANDWHCIENPGKVPVEVIEVRIGSYLGDDDTVHFEASTPVAAQPAG